MKYISSRPGFSSVNSRTPSRPVNKNDNRLVLSKLPFKLSIIMPILVPVGFVYKHGSPCSICRIKRTLRFWFWSKCVPGISFAYLYAYSKKSFGYFGYLIGYLRKYAAYLELCLFSSKDKSKSLKCHLLQFLFGTLRIKQQQDILLKVELVFLAFFLFLKTFLKLLRCIECTPIL